MTTGEKIGENWFVKKGLNDYGKQRWKCTKCKKIATTPAAHVCI
jgi:transposase-like protein